METESFFAKVFTFFASIFTVKQTDNIIKTLKLTESKMTMGVVCTCLLLAGLWVFTIGYQKRRISLTLVIFIVILQSMCNWMMVVKDHLEWAPEWIQGQVEKFVDILQAHSTIYLLTALFLSVALSLSFYYIVESLSLFAAAIVTYFCLYQNGTIDNFLLIFNLESTIASIVIAIIIGACLILLIAYIRVVVYAFLFAVLGLSIIFNSSVSMLETILDKKMAIDSLSTLCESSGLYLGLYVMLVVVSMGLQIIRKEKLTAKTVQ